MHPVAALIVENARQNSHLVAPLLFVVSSAIANVHGPVQHQLLVACVSWAFVWIFAILRAGFWSRNAERKRANGWLAGGFLALSVICDRAACDREGIWSTKGLLPLFVVLVSDHHVLSKYVTLPIYASSVDRPSDSGPDSERSQSKSYRLLAVVIIAASLVLATNFTAPSTSALGLSSAFFAAAGLVIFESASTTTKDGGNGRMGLMSANGSFSRRASGDSVQKEQQMAVLGDFAAAMTLACGVATYLMEPPLRPEAVTWVPLYHELPKDWKELQQHRTVQQVLLMIVVNVFVNVLMFIMVSRQGAVHASFLSLFSFMCARLRLTTSFSGIWFTIIYGLAALLFLSGIPSSFVDVRNSIRFRRIIFGLMALSIGLLLLRQVSKTHQYHTTHNDAPGFFASPPGKPLEPVPMDLAKGHPAAQLIDSAEKELQGMLDRQSRTLGDAVQEYRRRNGIAPPPHFDKWYEFATRNRVVLIDEFDTVTQSLLPFWALKPSTIRARISKALGHEDTSLIGVTIRDGTVAKIEGGPDWQQQATTRMIGNFVQYLPDMDLGFNIHDEPRVMVPNDHLSAMVAKAQDEVLPAVMKKQSPRNSFSKRPSDMNDGKQFEETSVTRFNRFAHQQTWTHARLSCPADSQAQKFEDVVPDNLTAYAATPLNYIYNHTAFSDICNSPSLSSTFGFFERPNAFSIIHELTPVFSQSKISSFQDILYPSPWYWFKKVEYVEDRDTAWENKKNSLYWRGSTTGGFSRNGGWRRQHRQRVVRRINALEKASIHVPKDSSPNPAYTLQEVDRRAYESLIDVKFSHIGQCDPGDCDAQKEFFQLTDHVDGQDAWLYKHLLDMDGNAFSGRFYSFLQSRSLTYKMAMFREWHQEWLRPWVHYVPFSLIGDEHLDLVRWFAGGDGFEKKGEETVAGAEDGKWGGNGGSLGERKAKEIAEKSRDWARRVLRNVDFEAWFFRLLLEYGRIIDDDRENIGYPGP